METVLVEVEGVLNFRPLTHVHYEIDDLSLTASGLVAGRCLLDQVTISENSAVADARLLGKHERQLNLLLTHFRNRWRNEYLTGIREYQRLSSTKQMRVGLLERLAVCG